SDDVEQVVVPEVPDPEDVALQRSLAWREDDAVVLADLRHELVAVDALWSPDGRNGPGLVLMFAEEVEAERPDPLLRRLRKGPMPLEHSVGALLEISAEGRSHAQHQRDGRGERVLRARQLERFLVQRPVEVEAGVLRAAGGL